MFGVVINLSFSSEWKFKILLEILGTGEWSGILEFTGEKTRAPRKKVFFIPLEAQLDTKLYTWPIYTVVIYYKL